MCRSGEACDERAPGVGLGIAEDILRYSTALDDLSVGHHHDRIRDGAGDGEIMGDEEIGDAEPAIEIGEEVKYLRADRHVERRNWLVGNDQLRFGDDGAGDGEALALATGKFMRIFVPVLSRRCQPAPVTYRYDRAFRKRREGDPEGRGVLKRGGLPCGAD